MMNELNKRANLLIEQLEVITFSFCLSFLSFSRPWIYMQRICYRGDQGVQGASKNMLT